MATSFKTDIVPLFTSVDVEHMSRLEVHWMITRI